MRPEELVEYQEMIDDCLDRDNQLSEWEQGYMNSLEEQLEEKGWISEKQTEILEKIWNRVTARG